jgi:anti-sigma regulatory factor (Ser/Thr protein kinase)
VALAPVPTSSYAARNFVTGLLRRWRREDLAEVAVLLTSEVVTNAVLHARTDLVLTVRMDGSRLRVSVRDDEVSPPRPRTPDAEGGRGLALVESLARSWGTSPHGRGKAVWFEL